MSTVAKKVLENIRTKEGYDNIPLWLHKKLNELEKALEVSTESESPDLYVLRVETKFTTHRDLDIKCSLTNRLGQTIDTKYLIDFIPFLTESAIDYAFRVAASTIRQSINFPANLSIYMQFDPNCFHNSGEGRLGAVIDLFEDLQQGQKYLENMTWTIAPVKDEDDGRCDEKSQA